MNYLFFDIECASCKDGGKLCEFGYVLTDGEFNIIGQENFLIDPACTFDFYVLKKMLNYPERVYRRSPKFPELYSKISSLLTVPDTLVIGHTTLGDCEHIGDDCIRYGLPVPSFDFVDITELYKLHSQSANATNLVKMCEELNVTVDGKAHSADVDALMTMLVCKELCARFECSFSALLDNSKNCRATFKDYELHYRMKQAVEEYKAECKANGTLLTETERYNVFTFAKCVKSKGEPKKTTITGKNIYIIDTYQTAHYTELINIIRLVASAGGKTVLKPNSCDIFVDHEIKTASGDLVYSKAKEKAERAARNGKEIEFIRLDELLKRIGVDDGEIRKPFKINFAKMAKEQDERVVYNEEAGGSPLGELL
ncbi:MAG: hypothetical protein HDT28_08105 [Clostridiales bacterium]|nr:hypothetical protein [Clostridiales bacterium]